MSWRECKNKTNASDAEELYVKCRQGFVVFLYPLKGRVCESTSEFSLEACQIFLGCVLIRWEKHHEYQVCLEPTSITSIMRMKYVWGPCSMRLVYQLLMKLCVNVCFLSTPPPKKNKKIPMLDLLKFL